MLSNEQIKGLSHLTPSDAGKVYPNHQDRVKVDLELKGWQDSAGPQATLHITVSDGDTSIDDAASENVIEVIGVKAIRELQYSLQAIVDFLNGKDIK